jgi:serine/threonine protein phosphatase 1
MGIAPNIGAALPGETELLNLFRRRASEPKAHCGPPGSRAYAIGDIHGRLDLLVDLLGRIERDNGARGPAKTWLVFLGDLVDRGPDSKGVIDLLSERPPRFARNVFLAGNHEEAFLKVFEGDTSIVPAWIMYGGRECAQSYGVNGGWMLSATPEAIVSEFRRTVPRSHVDFLSSMGDSFSFGDYVFVHAGVRPGVPLEEQSPQDLRWIREGFLDDETDHGFVIVHGHTIVDEVEERPNRIGIDTGAYRTGVLTAIGIEGRERWFLSSKPD